MKIINTKFAGLKVIQNFTFLDKRGYFKELIVEKKIKKKFPFNVMSFSKKNVLRGIHGDSKSWKLITCLSGEIKLVVVNPKTLQHMSVLLTSKNKLSVLVPPGFGNGHLVLSDEAVFYYKWAYEGEYPDVEDQFSLRWNDPKLKIEWGIKNPILSTRDQNSKLL